MPLRCLRLGYNGSDRQLITALMPAKHRKITIELEPDLFERFERCCEERSRQKAGQIRAMISDWVQAQETPLSVPLLPGPRGQFEDYCRRHQIAPHVWLAMQIQRVIRG